MIVTQLPDKQEKDLAKLMHKISNQCNKSPGTVDLAFIKYSIKEFALKCMEDAHKSIGK